MAVDPVFQKRGIGRFILDATCRIAKGKKINFISLYSYRPLENALRLYRIYGFKETGVKRDLFGIELFEMILDIT